MSRPLAAFSIAVALLAASLPGAAQKFLPRSIQFQGDPDYTDQELMDAAGLKKGATLTSDEMGDRTKRLMDTGVFERLSYEFDGQNLVFKLTPAKLLYPVRLDNLPLTPGKELDATLHVRFPLYHGSVPNEGGLLDDVRGALEDILAARGIKATVAAAPWTDQKLHKVTAMNFAITAPPVVVGAIDFQGVSDTMQARVKAVAARTAGAAYDTENAAANVAHAFELFYTDEGYAAAKVHAIQSESPVITAANISIPFSVGNAKMTLSISMTYS